MKVGKAVVKLGLFAGDLVVYTESPKKSKNNQ